MAQISELQGWRPQHVRHPCMQPAHGLVGRWKEGQLGPCPSVVCWHGSAHATIFRVRLDKECKSCAIARGLEQSSLQSSYVTITCSRCWTYSLQLKTDP